MKTSQLIRTLGIALILLLSNPFLGAQDSTLFDLQIGTWKNYLPFKVGTHITQSEEKIFYTTRVAVLVLDKDDPENNMTTLSKLNGLSNSTPDFIKYIPENESLIVTYDDSSFDQVFQNNTLTFENLKQDGNFFNREILNIQLLNNNKLYFSMAFGIVEFDPVVSEFGYTLDLGIPVTSLALVDGYFFAATEEGVYKALNDPSINLKDLNNWVLQGSAEGFPEIYSSQQVVNYNNQLYVTVNDSLFKYNGVDQLVFLFEREDSEPIFLTTEGEYLVAGFFCNRTDTGGNLVSCDGTEVLFNTDGFVKELRDNCIERPNYAIEDDRSRIWSADKFGDFRYTKVDDNSCTRIVTNAPNSQQVNEIALRGDEIWLSTNGISPRTLEPEANNEGIYFYVDEKWGFYKKDNIPELVEQGGRGFHRIIKSPDEEKFYVGTMVNGLVEVGPGPTFDFYSKGNSDLLEGVISGTVRVAGLAFDNEGNLWMTNNNANKPLAVLKPDGTLINDFSSGLSQFNDLRDMAIDFQGNKWFTVDQKGILVYDDNGTIDVKGDDRFVQLTSNNSNLPDGNRARSIEVDLDGEVWIGTSKGVVSFDCGSSLYDLQCLGVRQIVEVNGIRANLLETEDVWSIAVDGANRKWFGTTNGVFLMSPNGKEQLAFFDINNSPLPDNFVTDIKVHPTSGEVFFATGKGLVSFREGATEGAPFHKESEVFAFPNPVRPDYTGTIAIKGLTRDADVKITDVNGQLIYETKALGGQAVWDGRDYNGRKAATGVYLVFSTAATSNQGKPNTLVTKILFIN